MRHIIVLLLIFGSCHVFSQADIRIKRVIELKSKDTLKIQEFDLNGNLVFWKHFPTDYGISQILTYEYKNGKLIDYTWVHSNVGFIINEYSYDALFTNRLTYRYESKKKNKMTLKLPTVYSTAQLREAKQYKKTHKKRNKFLSEVSIYKDTLLMKEVKFNQHGDTTSITIYDYKNGLISKETRLEHNILSILTFNYDTLGNELSWSKVYPPADTSVQYIKKYNGKLLTKETSVSGSEKTVTQFYYKDDSLVREVMSNENGEIEREITYTYDKDKRLSIKKEDYLVLGQLNEFTYMYETF